MFRNLLKYSLFAGTFLATAASHQAMAATDYLSGVIFWQAGAPTTAFSGAGKEAAFSFDISSPTNNPATVTNFSYSLNNVPVIAPITNVQFYSTADEGLFDLHFGDITVHAFGADIGSTGVIGPGGFFPATFAVNSPNVTGVGGVSVSVSAVPLPASLPMFSAALLGLVGVGVKARRKILA